MKEGKIYLHIECKECLNRQQAGHLAALKAENADLRKCIEDEAAMIFRNENTTLKTENGRLRAIMTEHSEKCRGWFGENTAWEEEMFPEEVLLRRIEEREKS